VHVNVVIVGHVDHGKSTLIGRLLYDSQALPEDKLAEIQKLVEEYKKRFEFAYFLDSFEEELKEERTIDTTRVLFKGQQYYTIVDVPGHKEFIKNMLTGASHAQVAILVVSAPDGVQEQTGRHAFLLHMLGVKNIIVAVNKMDLVDYAETKFQEVKVETNRLLYLLGYTAMGFIPISAMEGDNIYKPSSRMDWYVGPTLIQTLSEKVVVGRVESGTVRKGYELVFQPSGVRGRVEKIKVFPGEVEQAVMGDSIGIVTEAEAKRGDVGGILKNPPRALDNFLGEVVLLEGRLKREDEYEIKCGAKRTKCLVKEIKERIDSETGEVMEKNVDEIRENEAATIIFETEPIVVEKFSDIPELGRFIMARRNKNIGAGVVLEAGR
jgi:elongation factor 1-alpha